MQKIFQVSISILMLACHTSIYAESIDCYEQWCDLDGTEWKCLFSEPQELTCEEKDKQADICYEETQEKSFRKGCWWTDNLSDAELEEMEKTGSFRQEYSENDKNETITLFCKNSLCNNVFTFTQNFTVDWEYIKKAHQQL